MSSPLHLVMTDRTYPLYPVFSFLGFIIALIPLPWHLQAWNSGTCLFMIWTSLGCLNLFINSILWHGNVHNKAPIWCDISTRFIVGLAVAIPASLLCISRRLYSISSVRASGITRTDRQRAIIIDLLIGVGLPVLQMALQIVVEGHRYDIFEDIGCRPALFHTPPAYPITLLWPPVLGLISLVYSALTLREFLRRRAQFSQFISANASITTNRYLRLMALSMTEILFNTPLSLIGLYITYQNSPMQPWKGWADAHFNYAAVNKVRGFLWRSKPAAVLALELSRWSPVICAFFFFAFFGFADEARRNYRNLFRSVTTRLKSMTSSDIGYSSTRSNAQRTTVQSFYAGSLPVFIRHSLGLKSSSFASSDRPSSIEKSQFSFYSSQLAVDCDLKSPTTVPTSTFSSWKTKYAVDPTSTATTASRAHTPSQSSLSRPCSSLHHPTAPPESTTHHPPTPEPPARFSTSSASSSSTYSCPEGFDMIEIARPVSCITTDSQPHSFRPISTLSYTTDFDTIYINDGFLPRAL